MRVITLSNWTGQEMRNIRGYSTSYTLRSNGSELFHVHLNRQMGFFEISEFFSSNTKESFILEQTNRSGTPKIAFYEKESANMLGTLRGNTLLDTQDEPLMHIRSIAGLNLKHQQGDYAAVLHGNANALCASDIAATFSRVPRRGQLALVTRLKGFLNRVTQSPVDVMEIKVFNDDICDLRVIFGLAVILHSRGGIQLH